MNLADSLLALSRRLADPGVRGAPRQVDLRRAVSTAYYALFHKLVHEAGLRFAGQGEERENFRLAVYGRAFEHAEMKRVAQGFRSGTPAVPYRLAIGAPPSPKLRSVADAFALLQEARHKADYDATAGFSKSEALLFVEQAEAAFQDLDSISGRLETDVFLTALLLGNERVRH